MWTVFLGLFSKIEWTPLKISVGLNIILIILLLFLYSGDEIVERVIVKDHYIEVPGQTGDIGPKLKPQPLPKVKEEDSTKYKELLDRYQKLESEKEKEDLYKESIVEREYKETFKDKTQEVEVYTRVQQGRIIEQAINYEINPYILKVRDSITVNSKDFTRNKILGGIELGIPLSPQPKRPDIVIKSTIYFQNKKDNIISLGVDSEETIWAGCIIKF